MRKKALFVMFLAVLLVCCSTALVSAFTLPDTGQMKCYNTSGAEIACTGTGQDGAYNINPMSYTDNGNGTITDNVTGLIWQKGENATAYNWYQASGAYDATYNPTSQNPCGSLGLAGHSDWRLPAKKELLSIVDYSIPTPGPLINTAYFPNTHDGYWSSTPDASSTNTAWNVSFSYGFVSNHGKSYGNYVRCVRGGQSSPSFTNNSNGTVTDNGTGLMWQQGEPGSKTWADALTYCGGLSLGGQSDWRLPNIKELWSIIDDAKYDPAIDTTYFPGIDVTSTYVYWSSTTNAYDTYPAWVVAFGDGYVSYYGRSSDYYVRCVRGGQAGALCNLTISPSSQTFTSSAATGSITVNASDSACAWTVSSALSWVTITSGANGTGIRTVTFSVSANTTGDRRTGNITVAGQNFTIMQSGTTSKDTLPDTGQTKCYNTAGAEISCAGSGQDGAYNINPMSYTDNGNGTITDNVTGLMWQKDESMTYYNWYQASGTYDAKYNPSSLNVCGSLGLAGQLDWRLPTKKELMSIVDYRIPYLGPAINTTYFISEIFFYWSSTTGSMDDAYYVDFYYGQTYNISKSGYGGNYVRCVRGGQSSPSFTNNGNGTVTDNGTGLMWQQGEPGLKTWADALTYCEGLSLGGQSDWRLPNIKELWSIIDDTKYDPAIDMTYFPNTYAGPYLSSTTSIHGKDDVPYVEFYNGNIRISNKSYVSSYVRCVRGGQSGSTSGSQNNCATSLTTELSLHIPILTYNGNSYWADFMNVPNTLNFTLTNANTVSDTSPYSGCTPASLSSDSKLHVPVIMFNGASYWADFLYTGGVNFSFVNAGGNY